MAPDRLVFCKVSLSMSASVKLPCQIQALLLKSSPPRAAEVRLTDTGHEVLPGRTKI